MIRTPLASCLFVLAAIAASGCRQPGPGARATSTGVEDPRQALLRMSTLLGRKDLAVVNEFADDPDVVLIGSGAGELGIGRQQIEQQMRTIYASPAAVRFEWRQTRSASQGDLAWLFADGEVILTAAGKETRLPYRLTGVLQQQNGRWKWRQFHGSAPAAP